MNASVETDLQSLLAGLFSELHPGAVPPRIAGGSSLQGDLGIDSLARSELVARIERRFRIQLQDAQLHAAESVADLLAAISAALRAPGGAPRPGSARPSTLPRPAALVPERARTLAEVLAARAQADPSRRYVTFYADDGGRQELRHGELLSAARSVASRLRALDLPARPVVAMMLPTSLEFFYCFYGILLAGGIPVPLYPPDRPSRIAEHLRRQLKILTGCGASLLVAPREAAKLRGILGPRLPELADVVTPEALLAGGAPFEPVALRGEDIALLQYTSGSTGDPKGVILSHSNLLANIRAVGERVRPRPDDVFVSWLPLYHDMGLIGACMGTLYYGVELVLMSPVRFILRPERWLRAIHDHRGTLSAAPNFAYELCARKIGDSALTGVDLSSWRAAFNGAEPVAAESLERFARRFGPYGFRREALTPLYGLAESTVGLTMPPLGRGPRIERVRRASLQEDARAVPAEDAEPSLAMVSCGPPLAGHELRIVDERGHELPEREVGKIQFRGPSSTPGYFENPAATHRLFQDGYGGPWLETGDYGYLAEGELYVSGRAKDMIIRGGRHLFPYEIEAAIGDVPEIRKGGVAVFGESDDASGTERIIVVAETRDPRDRESSALRERLVQRIRRIVIDASGVPPDEIVLAPAHAVLKTSSGKTRRADCRRIHQRGRGFDAEPAPWRQWAELRLGSLAPSLRRSGRRLGLTAYGCYFWALAGIFFGDISVGILLLPRASLRLAWTSAALRAFWRLSGVSLELEGAPLLDPAKPRVLVVNHASYIDSPILVALLYPRAGRDLRFAAKRELERTPLLGILLRRLGCIFLERFDPRSAAEDSRAIGRAIEAGSTVVVFPEGTFTRAPGLRSFRMGAFLSAASAGAAVQPISLRGTRGILRDGWKLARPGRVRAVVSTAVAPERRDWQGALRLRDGARAEMLLGSGEPDLGQ